MAEKSLILSTDVLTGYIQPVSDSNFSFLGKVGIHFTQTKITPGQMINTYNQIGYSKEVSEDRNIFSFKSTTRPKGRGSQTQQTGDNGLTFDLQFTLSGRYYALRNKVHQLLTSGEPLWFYDPQYQKINSSKTISNINFHQDTRNRFYVKVSSPFTISSDSTSIGKCTISGQFKEQVYKPKSVNTSKVATAINFIDNISAQMDNVDQAINEGVLALTEANNLLFDTANKISSFGQDISTVLSEINNLKINTNQLIRSPSLLIENFSKMSQSFTQMFKTASLGSSASDSRVSTISPAIKSMASFEVDKPNTQTRLFSKSYISYDAVRSLIVIGKIVFTIRALALLIMIYTVRDLKIHSKEEAISLNKLLEYCFDQLMLDDSYDGIDPSLTTVDFYSEKPRKDEELEGLIPLYSEASNYLKSAELSLGEDDESKISKRSNIFSLMYQHYGNEITQNNFDEILERLLQVNQIKDPSVVLNVGDDIVYPINY